MAPKAAIRLQETADTTLHLAFDWRRIAYLVHLSRALDEIEETRLVPEKKVLYQFSARGHDVAQVMLASRLTGKRDAVAGYYRSRPTILTLGVDPIDAAAAPMARSGSYSDGRDVGVTFNFPNLDGPCALPMCGGVGTQYTPIAGWAQAIEYYRDVLKDESYRGSIAVVLGGDGSVASNGFWAALTIATTAKLPVLFYIEDNGYGISVTADKQTPGANIAANLASFQHLFIRDGDGTDPAMAADLIDETLAHVRAGHGPALLRLTVPRLCGHSFQDTQTYKSAEVIAAERARDPLPKLKAYLVPNLFDDNEWNKVAANARADAEAAVAAAMARPDPDPDPAQITRHVVAEQGEVQQQGGLLPLGHTFPTTSETATPEPTRINMVTAIRRTLDHELATNPKVVVFGEDVGAKGGVHAVTMGLAAKYGDKRVADTSLSEEGIIGRAVGMALAGLMPVAEIQFRKYADPAEEQLNDCGTMRWRTCNRFAAPMVVRIPGGFFKCGDPWHSQMAEVKWAHAIGWQLAIPSNAEDAVGLLRTALRDNNPTIFFEHRAMLDDPWARRPYPGDDYVVPFGRARHIRHGNAITIVTWGAMVARCAEAAANFDADVLDLRTLSPWDKTAVISSVKRTNRCLIVHEDTLTAGFGAEIAATLMTEAFLYLDAPVERLAMPDVPSPHNLTLMDAVVPSVEQIAARLDALLRF